MVTVRKIRQIMKNLFLLAISTCFILLWTVLYPFISCKTDTNYSFYDLNFPKKDPNFKLTHGYKLLFNDISNRYIITVPDGGITQKGSCIMLYHAGGMNSDIWVSVDLHDATLFKDSSVAKFYAHLYFNKQVYESNFKILTK